MTDDVFVPSFEDVAPEEPVCEEVGCANEPVETAEPAVESAEPVEAETPVTDDTAVEEGECDCDANATAGVEASEPTPVMPAEELGRRLDALDEGIAQLTGLFRQKIDRTTFEEEVLKNNSAEIERYRSGVYEKITTPLFKRVLSVIAEMDKLLAHLATLEDDAAKQQEKDLSVYRDMLSGILRDFGVTSFAPEPGDRFESGRHTLAMPRNLTGDPEKRGIIIEVLSPGYELSGSVLSPAYVRAYTYKKGYTEPEQQLDKDGE